MERDKVSALADGRTHIASKALEMGLIDAVQSLDDTLAEMNVEKTSKRSRVYDTAVARPVETRASSVEDSWEQNKAMLTWNRALDLEGLTESD